MAVSFDYLQLLKLCAPETIVVVTALVVLFLDLAWLRTEPNRTRMTLAAMFTAAGCVAAFMWMLVVPEKASLLNGMLVVDPLTQLVKQSLLVLTLFTALLSIETTFTDHVGEFFALLLLATVGMMFLVSSEELLMIFVSLELTSLSLYILTAFNKHNSKSAEAALKYFLFGGMAAAATLFGMSLIYGLSGATNLRAIAAALTGPTLDPLLLAAIVMTVIGLGFKVAAVPFHLWVPDAYEGAPTPSAAFIASGSKVASFFILAKVMMLGFAGAEGSGAWKAYVPGWVPVIALVAALSLVLGNLAAIAQKSVKRLLAYSAIAHAGYMLLGVMADSSTGVASLVFYVITYALTTVGAFGVVAIVEQSGGDKLTDFAGLSRRAPLVALCLMVFILSLAGIPPLAGFFGKFYLFTAAAAAGKQSLGLLWLVILALAMSCVSLYYYLKVLKQAYVAPSPEDAPRLRVEISSSVALIILAAGVVLLGCAPNLLLGKLLSAIKAAGF
ncbi:MAG: NADH-quinone oxidoreductase subunit N [Verrucomicrobia bacterium]|nr:NADH-quinone oxidoreductase subunit N [Verrucomicrobiota bacterium]